MLGRRADPVESLARRDAGVEIGEREPAVAADHGQHVVEVVRDPSGECSDRFELLGGDQPLLQYPFLGHVTLDHNHVGDSSLKQR